MNEVQVASKLVYQVETPTVLLLNVAVASTSRQHILSEDLNILPFALANDIPVGEEANRFTRIELSPGEVTISYTARVRLSPYVEDAPTVEQVVYGNLPAEVLTYLNPSRYCESDRLANFAYAQFGNLPPNHTRITAICDWIFEHLAYTPGATTSLTTACDVLISRQGVCRDFAHLAIAFCRSLGVPARYVSGYACRLEPPDFHGFFEAYLDGRWFLFDPTRLAPPAGLVRIGAGRDAADAAFATISGSAKLLSKTVAADEIADTQGLLNENPGEVAVSTA